MKRKFKPILFLFLFIINISALVSLAYNRWVKTPSSYHQQEAFETLEALQEPMALNQKQFQQMKDLRVALESEIITIREQMQKKRQTLATEMNKSKPDLTIIDNVIDEISYLQSRIQKKTIRNLMQDKKILTPSQQTRYFSMFEDHVRGMGRGRGRRGRARKGLSQRRNQ
jgi:Spy/CpxP family protein refolding chaperone